MVKKIVFVVFIMFVSSVSWAQTYRYTTDYYECKGDRYVSSIEFSVDEWEKTAKMSNLGTVTKFKILYITNKTNATEYTLQDENWLSYTVIVTDYWIIIHFPYYFDGLCEVVKFKIGYIYY
jgi:hypothetical protein